MPRYRVEQAYQSYRDGKRYGWWPQGQVIDITEEEADWVNRDSPGTLTPEKTRATKHEPEPSPEPEVTDAESEPDEQPLRARKPARNRQHRPSQTRSG